MGMENKVFEAQRERTKLITGKRTPMELADLLGVQHSCVPHAQRGGKIPSCWLVILMPGKYANLEGSLTGNEPVVFSFPPFQMPPLLNHWSSYARHNQFQPAPSFFP